MKDIIMKKVDTVPDKTVLIDLLSNSSYEEEHIKGAKNVCVYEVAFLDKMNSEYPDKDLPICIYGWNNDTGEVDRAYNLLIGAGYSNITVLDGGLEKMRKYDDTVEKGVEIEKLEGGFLVDTQMSTVEWIGRKIGKKHIGRILVKSGKCIFTNGVLKGGELILDMNSISNIDLDETYKNYLINHLKSDDFFAVDKYPEAKLVFEEIDKLNAIGSMPNYRIKALLTIKDITKEIEFNAFIHDSEGKMIFNAHFDIDRTRWNVKYGSEVFFSKVGIHIVDDVISFDLILFGNKE